AGSATENQAIPEPELASLPALGRPSRESVAGREHPISAQLEPPAGSSHSPCHHPNHTAQRPLRTARTHPASGTGHPNGTLPLATVSHANGTAPHSPPNSHRHPTPTHGRHRH